MVLFNYLTSCSKVYMTQFKHRYLNRTARSKKPIREAINYMVPHLLRRSFKSMRRSVSSPLFELSLRVKKAAGPPQSWHISIAAPRTPMGLSKLN